MILTSTTKSIPYTPPWRVAFAATAGDRYERNVALLRKEFDLKKDQALLDHGLAEAVRVRLSDETLPVFYLRAGGVIERGMMEAELSGPYRAGRVAGWELVHAVRAGIQTLLADHPDVDHLLGLIDAEWQGDEESFSADDKQLLTQTRDILAQHWPDYRDLLAQRERRREIAPIVALRQFCTGWENCTDESGRKPAIFELGRDGLVTEAALAGLTPLEMTHAGSRAFDLQYISDDLLGNSPPPGLSEPGPVTSSSDDTSTAVGKSTMSSGKKTPA